MQVGTLLSRRGLIAAALLTLALVVALVASGDPAGAAPTASVAKKKGGVGLNVVSKTFSLSQADNAVRYETLCPKGKYPYGGGIKSTPDPANGEGVYPNSFERLGVQHGYHINGTLVKATGGDPAARNVTIQAVCGSKPGNISPPHRTTFVSPGETKTLTMSCNGKRVLMGGGYQRTTGRSNAGNVITESHAVDDKTWKVTSHGLAQFGGELTGIAYCIKSKQPILKQVSATVPLATDATATATTAGCGGGRKPAFGGFETASTGDVMYFGGYFTTSGTWAATAYNEGPPTSLTAHLYCIRPFKK